LDRSLAKGRFKAKALAQHYVKSQKRMPTSKLYCLFRMEENNSEAPLGTNNEQQKSLGLISPHGFKYASSVRSTLFSLSAPRYAQVR